METEHRVLVVDAEEGAQLPALRFGVVGERLVAQFVVEVGPERSASAAPTGYVQLPPERAGGHGVLDPGRKVPCEMRCLSLPVDRREANVAAVADEVNEPRFGPEVV